MRFWDSSALVPLLVLEEATIPLRQLYLKEDGVLVWWGAEVQCTSAIARLERAGHLTGGAALDAFSRLGGIARSWNQIEPSEAVKEAAKRLLRVHDLRAADALQLAAAFVAAEGRPSTLEILCLDDRLAMAAQREGFNVLGRDELEATDRRR